ncbi:hypothetical protein [Actinomyces succiniciruminis]|uniref:Uncharacterized protein n=1 Tax=Actinomyces succiniciruminis TaxID=1522002 RepID=A0A1L7R9W4_9ACTO|nr:hypothetical protein [Actinomyces succiniciruminis]CED90601.1 Hypothetical protein AAM4_0769 [Actinomyces succiniciruminis]
MRIHVTVTPDLGPAWEITATAPPEQPMASSASDTVAAIHREQDTAAAILTEIAAYARDYVSPRTPAGAPDVTYQMHYVRGGDA